MTDETQTEYKTEIQREENGGSRYLQTRVLSQHPLIRAYLGDCMDWMQAIADKAYDLAIVDPPYGISSDNPSIKPNRIVQKNGSILYIKQSLYKNKHWDTMPDSSYFDDLRRISKNQIIWGCNYYHYDLAGGRIVWDKVNGNSDQYDCEIAYNSLNKRTDLVRYMWCGMFQGKSIREGEMQQGNKKLNEKRIHPTQKPVALYRWLLQNYAKAGQRIFDSHGGSFSSAVACYIEGFDLDICEIDEEYFEMAVKRFKQATQQIHLFDERLL